MAGPRIFISSTCYDLSLLRSQLRIFVKGLGYDPVMSDYEDVLYDPREHTHTSCINEVTNSDMLVLIIGSRFGGRVTTEALNKIDFEILKDKSKNTATLKDLTSLSVTQLEVLKAVELDIPIYTFIDKKVWHDHELFEKNKLSDIIEKIIFPSIEKQETAKFIFDFINFVRTRTRGNNIFTFEKGQDIEDTLRKQWSSYFQRLLSEERYKTNERRNIDALSEKFEDLKTAMLSTIDNIDQREVARGIVKYRRLMDFIGTLKNIDKSYLKVTQDSWKSLLKKDDVIKVIIHDVSQQSYSTGMGTRCYLIKSDNSFYSSRISYEIIENLSNDWTEFISIPEKSRAIIVDTLLEMYRPSFLRYYREDFDKYLENKLVNVSSAVIENIIIDGDNT